MIQLVSVLLGLGALFLSVPSTVFIVECLLALLPARRPSRPPASTSADGPSPPLRFAILIPAHDEAAVIRETLKSVAPELGVRDRMLVVADNCTDDTATLARSISRAEVVERNNPDWRGKGYALMFGLEQLEADPPDVVIVFDADCRVSQGSLRQLAEKAAASYRPVQADYLLLPPRSRSPLAKVSSFAFLVRNRVRPLGMARIGMPCHLTGTGMAFPWKVMRLAPATGSALVEDLLMGLDLAVLGYPALYTDEVRVTSVLPGAEKAARGQRRRWEHGQLDVARNKAPRMMIDGIRRGRLDLLALGLDLLVPPLALLAAVMLLSFLVTVAAAVWLETSLVPVAILGGALGLVGAVVILVWLRFARHVIGAVDMLAIPFYLLWKIPLYLSFAMRRRQVTWERTERSPSSNELSGRTVTPSPASGATTPDEAAASTPGEVLGGAPK